MHIDALPAGMSVYHGHAWCPWRVLDPLELELHMVVTCHVCGGD